jgi:predicted enzyme related to lactoylglutathione lyase
MALRIYTLSIDCADPRRLGKFWAEVLDFKVEFEDDEEFAIEKEDGSGTALLFIKVPDGKSAKNRLHLDLAPDDQMAEVERVKALGATEVDIGQKDVTWVVMADPEGNEFCILTPKDD